MRLIRQAYRSGGSIVITMPVKTGIEAGDVVVLTVEDVLKSPNGEVKE